MHPHLNRRLFYPVRWWRPACFHLHHLQVHRCDHILPQCQQRFVPTRPCHLHPTVKTKLHVPSLLYFQQSFRHVLYFVVEHTSFFPSFCPFLCLFSPKIPPFPRDNHYFFFLKKKIFFYTNFF